MIKVEKLILGYLDTNCYIVSSNNKAIIIDPADNYEQIINFCKKYEVIEIIVTHHHLDHIGALKEIEKYYNLKHNDFSKKTLNYEIIKTPGHTDDSISIFFPDEKIVFSGDLIFCHAIGRYDFPNSNYENLKESLNIISKLPINTIIYPGHGKETTLKEEIPRFKYY